MWNRRQVLCFFENLKYSSDPCMTRRIDVKRSKGFSWNKEYIEIFSCRENSRDATNTCDCNMFVDHLFSTILTKGAYVFHYPSSFFNLIWSFSSSIHSSMPRAPHPQDRMKPQSLQKQVNSKLWNNRWSVKHRRFRLFSSIKAHIFFWWTIMYFTRIDRLLKWRSGNINSRCVTLVFMSISTIDLSSSVATSILICQHPNESKFKN